MQEGNRSMLAHNGSFHKILVASDFSEYADAAFERAVELAQATAAELTVVHVLGHVAAAVPATSFEAHWKIPPADLKKAERRLRREADQRLTEQVEPGRTKVWKLRTETRVGIPFVEVIGMVEEKGFDLVVAGTRGLSGLKRVLVGSTAERLVRKCPCPVWIVKPGHDGPLRSILAPVDFSDVSGKSLKLAADLARLSDCRLDVLHVLSSSDDVVRFPDNAAHNDLILLRQEVRRSVALRLSQFVGQHVPTDVAVRERLAVGAPWQKISSAARRLHADLVVLGSVGRTGIPGFIIGNTAEKVLRYGDLSLLTVKPDGFVSPVLERASTLTYRP